jgi:NAD(P)-dependent dehydrogenase (short-subunit alcohol dehydrogenase family)
VNNASPAIQAVGQFADLNSEALFDTLLNDLWVPAQCMRHELKLMRGPGAIINIGSINSSRPVPRAAMYSAAKHGLEGLTKSIALEAVSKNIRVNAVAPGATWTARWEARVAAGKAVRQDVEEMIPMQRFARAEEIAEAVAWLASEKSAYVVGHTLVVDGGLSLV